jgi:hypothetical protein
MVAGDDEQEVEVDQREREVSDGEDEREEILRVVSVHSVTHATQPSSSTVMEDSVPMRPLQGELRKSRKSECGVW